MSVSPCAPTIKGEGGSFALLSLIARNLEGEDGPRALVLIGRACDLPLLRRRDDHAGDLGALGGRGPDDRQRALQPLVLPISIGILIGLFLIQARGTARVGSLFGPVMLLYFAVLAVLGVVEHRAAPGDRRDRSTRSGR